MESVTGWLAPAATMLAAMVVAANLGSRITGWGFVVFTVGSVSWTVYGFTQGETGLIITNAVLTLVNLVGIWRWLGRQAKYEDGGEEASRRSAAEAVPTLYSASALVGRCVETPDGQELGKIVDAMMHCDGNDIAYVVIGDGGVTGVGEHLRAVGPEVLYVSPEGVRCTLSVEEFASIAPIADDSWPDVAPDPGSALERPAATVH